MEKEIEKDIKQNNLYEKVSNSWNIVFDYLDINSLIQSEMISKYFRNQILLYYEAKENSSKITKNNIDSDKAQKDLKIYKKNFLSKYFNLLVHINISDKKFCNENSNSTKNEEKSEFQKKAYPKTELNFFKNRIQTEQILLQDNKFFILYTNNIFSILKFDALDTNKKFNEIFSYNFMNNIINKFVYLDNQNEKIIFFIKENSTEFYYLNINEEKMNMELYDLKKEFDIFMEENLTIKNIYTLNEFLLFLTNKEEFILIPNKLFKIFKNKDIKKDNKDNKKSDDEDNKEVDNKNEENIIYPKKLENNYGSIKYIYSNSSNVILLNNEYQIYSIPMSDYKNYINQIPKFKLFSEQKFPNFYTMSGSSNYFILLEKESVKPLEQWNNNEIYNWFEEMELDDYLNIIKNQKITGKDLVHGGKDYLLDFMGMEEDDMKKLNYEMNLLKYDTTKDMKLWGWGNNKNGQLGINNESFVKNPTAINLPNMLNDDTIEKIFCSKTYSVLLTKFGNIFMTGNYSIKDQISHEKKNKEKEKNKHHKDKHKEKTKKNDKNKDKDKNKDNDNAINNNIIENKWVNLSQNICYSKYNLYKGSNKNKNGDSYFKVKDIFFQDNNIYFIGFYSNTTPFFAIQRKPKFKHLKKGGKFIMSSKVIEHIQEYLKDKISTFKVVYGDSLLKLLETTLDDYLQSEIPYHKIVQIKDGNEVIWDRKKRYFKENFINSNINK